MQLLEREMESGPKYTAAADMMLTVRTTGAIITFGRIGRSYSFGGLAVLILVFGACKR